MASSTYLELVNEVSRDLGENMLTSSNFDTARGVYSKIKKAVRDTVDEISGMKVVWPFNIQAGTQVLVVGQEEYSWPAGFLYADWQSFYIEKSDPLSLSTRNLEPIGFDEWQKYGRQPDLDSGTDGRSTPENVFPVPNGFGVTPSPNQAATVKWRYYAVPARLSLNTDVTTIPEEWDYVITAGALAKCNLYKEDPQSNQIQEKKFRDVLANMQTVLIPTETDSFFNTMVNPRPYSRAYLALWPT